MQVLQQVSPRLRGRPFPAGLRDRAAQRALSELAALPNVHLAASVDHANAALLWDQQASRQGGGCRAGGAVEWVESMLLDLKRRLFSSRGQERRGAANQLHIVDRPLLPEPLLTRRCPRPLPQTRDRFSWVWHNATNYAPYLREVGFAGESWSDSNS